MIRSDGTIDFMGTFDKITTFVAKYGPTILFVIVVLLIIFMIILFWSENR